MCELFALNTSENIVINDYLEKFYSHSDVHKNGWGMAALEGDSFSLEKEPVRALDSSYLKERLREPISVRCLTAHIRWATIGAVSYSNTHPFVGRDRTGRQWIFMHNGTIFDFEPCHEYVHEQKGTTDSERILLYIIDVVNEEIEKRGRDLSGAERCTIIEKIAGKMTVGNKLNFLLYDGDLLYVHSNEQNTLLKKDLENGVMISTQALDDGSWNQLDLSTLYVYANGREVYRGEDYGFEYIFNKEQMDQIFMAYSGL